MKKLNNRGITTIEVIVCFVLVVTITVSLFSLITSLNEKRTIEGYKSRIYTYKNTLTREIQSDIVKRGLTHATSSKKITSEKITEYKVDMEFRDGSTRQLLIKQRLVKSDFHLDSQITNADDYFMIEYGNPSDMLEYPIPDLGEIETGDGKIAKDLSINNVEIETTNHVLSIYIGFYHPELETRYSINIVCPIDYNPSSVNKELFS